MQFQPGNKLGKGMPKGHKTYKTVAKEKAREVFENAQLKKWLEISEAQAKEAVTDFNARRYTIDQTIGKAKETIEHQGLDFIFDEKDPVE